MSQMVVEQAQARKRKRSDLIVLAAVTLVLGALVVMAAMHQEELLSYWRLRGWDTGSVTRTVKRFVRGAYDGQPAAGDLLDSSWCQPVIEKGKFVGVRHQVPGILGPAVTRFKTLFPAGEVKDCRVRIKSRSAIYQADVQFPDGQWAPFDVSRIGGALRIRSVPGRLTSRQPQPQPWD